MPAFLRIFAQNRAISSELAPRSSKKWSSVDTRSTVRISAIASTSRRSVSAVRAATTLPVAPACSAGPVGFGSRLRSALFGGRHRDGVELLEKSRDHVGRQPALERLENVCTRQLARTPA